MGVPKTFEEVMKYTSTISTPDAFGDEECLELYRLCQLIPWKGVVVEIGCELGRSSSIILQRAKERDFTSVHIDPYIDRPEYLPLWMNKMSEIGQPFVFFKVDSHSLYHWLVVKAHMVLIDGDHSYQSVCSDAILANELLYPGGLMLFHDYGENSLPEVYKAANLITSIFKYTKLPQKGILGAWRKRDI